ncbi:hypothetical protein HK405_015206, partial [Cladochytrium tenue]
AAAAAGADSTLSRVRMILGIGVDVLHVARLRALLTRRPPARLARRVLTPAESRELARRATASGGDSGVGGGVDLDAPLQLPADGNVDGNMDGPGRRSAATPSAAAAARVRQQRVVEFLAGRWAAKEAAFKAMQPHAQLRWGDVSVLSDGAGRPALHLAPEVTARLPFADVSAHVSISHDGGYAVAMVVFEAIAGDAATSHPHSTPRTTSPTASNTAQGIENT